MIQFADVLRRGRGSVELRQVVIDVSRIVGGQGTSSGQGLMRVDPTEERNAVLRSRLCE